MSNYGITTEQAKACLESLTPFSTGTLSGAFEYIANGERRFIVRSYGVEIADKTEGALHPKAKTYSQTTSRHANLVAKAWGLN